MSDSTDEFLESVDLADGALPSDDALRELTGLSRADATELMSRWDDRPVDIVKETLARLSELVVTDRALEFDELFWLCLSHDDEEIRERAVVALSGNGDPRLVETFSLMLRDDPDEGVREKSAVALGAYADVAESGRLTSNRLNQLRATLEHATDDASVRVAGSALVAYAGIPGNSPTELIEEWCDRADEDDIMMSYAFAAMGSSSERHWFTDVQYALDHPSARVRVSATLAFGQLANDDDDLGFIEAQLDDESLEVQLATVMALRLIGTSDARSMLIATAETNPEPSVRETAVSSLHQLKDDDDLRHAVTPEMEASGLYGGGGTASTADRDIGRYDAPTEEGWSNATEEWSEDDYADDDDNEDDDDEDDSEDERELAAMEEDIGEDLEDYYESEEFWRGMG